MMTKAEQKRRMQAAKAVHVAAWMLRSYGEGALAKKLEVIANDISAGRKEWTPQSLGEV